MLVALTSLHPPATDLGFLLMKNPARTWEGRTSRGRATVHWPEATAERATAVLTLEVDAVGLVRGAGTEDQYVNDRPYVANSYLSVALGEAFGTAMAGRSRERPELAATAIPLRIEIPVVRGPAELVERFFGPLGWRVAATPIESGRYVSLVLEGTLRVADALRHLAVLLPALDDRTHYWVGENEIASLLARGEGWLDGHPERDAILGRSLRRRRDMVDRARALLGLPDVERRPIPRAHDERLDRVAQLLRESGATSVLDLGCGEGRLLSRLLPDGQFGRLTGVDPEVAALDRARTRLLPEDASDLLRNRIRLLQGTATLPDSRLEPHDAAVLVEVIEHLDEESLPRLEEVVFAGHRPRTVIVTTPNADHNALFPSLDPADFRHTDHRFEWDRTTFTGWSDGVAARRGYSVVRETHGAVDPERGGLTQIAVFTREEER